MKNSYSEKFMPAIEGCGKNGIMNFVGAAVAFMNIAKIHEDSLGCNIYKMRERKLHWVMAKTQIRLVKPIKLLTQSELTTWGHDVCGSRYERQYAIGNIEDPYTIGRAQWALLDDAKGCLGDAGEFLSESHVLEKTDMFEEEWPRVERDFENASEIGRYKVKSTDIDFVGHTNNVAYSRGLLSCYSADELTEMKELYIQFVHSCMENDLIVYYAKEGPDGSTDYCGIAYSQDSAGIESSSPKELPKDKGIPCVYARIKK